MPASSVLRIHRRVLGIIDPEDGGTKLLRNFGECSPVDTT
jgi:hypothetical protein